MTNDAPILRTHELSVGHHGHVAVRDISLVVHPGDFWFFLGPNGSGKTTCVRTIIGLLPALAGVLELRSDLDHRRALGYVPQRCDLNPSVPTTVRELVSLGLVGIDGDRRARDERVRAAVASVGLDGMERADYWTLSGGQRQRVLLARALVRDPTLLVLDEPTSGHDPAIERGLVEALRDLNRARALTILFVSHDLALAESLATHVALFSGGRAVTGARADVLTPENVRRVYGFGGHAAECGGRAG